jgi:ESF2/ABP1 family protein
LSKRGVVYVARVPPKMNPTKIKSLLSDFGTVTRVYLVEEDAARRKRRRKATGNATKRYMEGWVEFQDKGIAKHVARSLNMTPISMHKRNVHYGTLFLAWF